MTKQSSLVSMKTDSFGNNVNFPNEIMSEMTTKGLLGKWLSYILSEIQRSLATYYLKTGNVDAGDFNFVVDRFKETREMVEYYLPVLHDLVEERISGLEDITIAVYGISSDEVFLVRRFQQLCISMPVWKEHQMWNDCKGDSRMKKIIHCV